MIGHLDLKKKNHVLNLSVKICGYYLYNIFEFSHPQFARENIGQSENRKDAPIGLTLLRFFTKNSR